MRYVYDSESGMDLFSGTYEECCKYLDNLRSHGISCVHISIV